MADTLEEYAAAQAAEYGRYVANGPIYFGGALAYTKDHPVPTSNVEAHKYLEQGLVREVGTELPTPELPPAPQTGEPIVVEAALAADVAPEDPSLDPSDANHEIEV